jgi:hypothetical protein
MLNGAEFPVYSEVNTKHVNRDGEICHTLSFNMLVHATTSL